MTRAALFLRAIATAIASLPIYALTALVVYDLVTSNHAGLDILVIFPVLFIAFFPVFILLSFLLFLYPIALYASFNPLRVMRAVRDGDAPPLPAQPSTDGALAPGESLRIERTRPLQSIIRELLGQLVGVSILMGMLEAFFLAFLPQQRTILGNAVINDNISPLSSLTIWDLITLAYPLILIILFISFSVNQALSSRRWSLAADDQGITLMTGRKRLSAQWSTIRAVVFNRHQLTPDHPEGQYAICTTDDRFIPLIIDPPPVQSTGAKMKYSYRDGYDRYAGDILRIFATMRARSFATFHFNNTGERTVRWAVKRAPLLALNNERALDTPIAEASLQPSIFAVAPVEGEIKVASRLDWRRIIPNGIIFDAFFVGCIFLIAHFSAPPSSLQFSWNSLASSFIGLNPIEIFILVSIGILTVLLLIAAIALIGAFGFVVAYTQQRKRFPRLIIKDEGIVNTQRESNNSKDSAIILWRDMRAWIVLPAAGRRHYDTYVILYGEKGKYYWRVNPTMQLAGRKVQGNRQAAFQERLRMAHTIIAAKTGLPLRIYSNKV